MSRENCVDVDVEIVNENETGEDKIEYYDNNFFDFHYKVDDFDYNDLFN
jgi:hypothetical protein